MNVKRWTNTAACMALVGFVFSVSAWASTNDREYLLGDDGAEGASNGSTVTTTFDSEGASGMFQLVDLAGVNNPVYRTITGRPDGGGGLGIEFSGASSQYLRGFSLNFPQDSRSGLGSGVGTINYDGIADRGMQFWVQPTATTAQSLVIDTNQHGARINASGNFSMRYDGRDIDTGVVVTPNTWYHLMVVRPAGAAGGSRMYVDGIAVAVDNESDYASDTANLVVGSNTGGDDQNFTGGTEEFFSGIIDDLTMFVIGESPEHTDPLPVVPGVDFGGFDFATENAFAGFTLSGVVGDVDNSGAVDVNDKTDFISGWMSENLVNDIRVGDLNSLGNGDLNFDGITDIHDLVIIQSALPLAGVGAITAADLNNVPEPATSVLILLGAAGVAVAFRQRR